jgi:hypothetical protein
MSVVQFYAEPGAARLRGTYDRSMSTRYW